MSTERDALQELLDDYPVRSVYGSEIHARAKAALATLFEAAAPVAQAGEAIAYLCTWQSGFAWPVIAKEMTPEVRAICAADKVRIEALALASHPQAAPTGSDAEDAARYRWLRACGPEWSNLCILDSKGNVIAESLDAEIDAARALDKGSEHG